MTIAVTAAVLSTTPVAGQRGRVDSPLIAAAAGRTSTGRLDRQGVPLQQDRESILLCHRHRVPCPRFAGYGHRGRRRPLSAECRADLSNSDHRRLGRTGVTCHNPPPL